MTSRLLGPLMLTSLLLSTPAMGAESSSTLDDTLQTFVGKTYYYGVPYKQAHELGPRAVPTLTRLLQSDASKGDWENIVGTIAYIGSPECFEPLRAFVQDRFKGEVDIETFQALIDAQISMGPAARHSAAGVEFLERGANPANWSGLQWTYRHYTGDLRGLLWSRLSITALSHTGSARAGVILTDLNRHPYSEKQRDAITEGLARHQEISLVGVERYVEDHVAEK